MYNFRFWNSGPTKDATIVRSYTFCRWLIQYMALANGNTVFFVTAQVLLVVSIRNTVLWHVMPCGLVQGYQHFEVLEDEGNRLMRNDDTCLQCYILTVFFVCVHFPFFCFYFTISYSHRRNHDPNSISHWQFTSTFIIFIHFKL